MKKRFYLRKEDMTEDERKTNRVSYQHLVERYIENKVLCNNIPKIDPSIFENVEVGEITEDTEIYQYFLCNLTESNIENLREYETDDILIMYSEVLDCHILAVEHLGTNWNYVLTDVEIED